jgi:hypothetical protein
MARPTTAQANTNLQTTNAIGQGQQNQANQLQNTLIPGYTNLMNTGYLSPQDQEAATQNTMGATTAPFSTADFEAKNRASATNNASDLTANEDQLAMEEGQAAGGSAANLQQQQMANQLQGMYGLGQEQQGAQGEAESMYGLAPSTLNAETNAQAQTTSWLNSLLGAAGTAAGGYLK